MTLQGHPRSLILAAIESPCIHNSPTLQTDGQTTCDRNTALCTKVHRAVKRLQLLLLRDEVLQTPYQGIALDPRPDPTCM